MEMLSIREFPLPDVKEQRLYDSKVATDVEVPLAAMAGSVEQVSVQAREEERTILLGE